jgi:hypothetical protein
MTTGLEELQHGFALLAKGLRDADITHEQAAEAIEEVMQTMPITLARAEVRTLLARAALTGLIARVPDTMDKHTQASVVRRAWKIADAMLAAGTTPLLPPPEEL